MIETLFGGLLGGIFRCVPELLKWLDRKDERAHELAMQDKQIQYTQIQGAQKINEIAAENQGSWNTGYIEALKQALSSQSQPLQFTGKWYVDILSVVANFLSITVRPVITYWFFAIYCSAKIAMFIGMIQTHTAIIEAIKLIWTVDDQALLAGILNFWFLNRVFEKTKL